MRTEFTKEEKREFEILIQRRIDDGSFPSIVYKFRCWDDEPNDFLLKRRTIYLSSPSDLQADYPEAILPIDEAEITEENLMKLAEHHTEIYFPNLPDHLAKLKASELRASMLIEDPEHRKEAEAFAIKRNDETLGIFCSSITYDNPEMWEKMACLGTGFAVGLNLKELLLDDRISGSALFVKYYPLNNPPKVSPFSFSESERVQKAIKEIRNIPDIYSYEREIRIVRTNRVIKNGIVQAYKEKDRIVELNDNHLEEILIGESANQNDRNEMIKVARSNFPTTPIYDIVLNGNGSINKKLIE